MTIESQPVINLPDVEIHGNTSNTTSNTGVHYSYGIETAPSILSLHSPNTSIIPAQAPTSEYDEPDREEAHQVVLPEVPEVIPTKDELLSGLLTEKTVLTPVLQTVQEISQELQTTSRRDIPHTWFNEVGLMDNQILQYMEALPVQVNGVPLTLPEILNGAYALEGVPAESMYSVRNGRELAPTSVQIQDGHIRALHGPNTYSTVGNAFGPRAVTVFSDPWRQASEAFQHLLKNEKQRMFYIAPPEKKEASEKEMFEHTERLFQLVGNDLSQRQNLEDAVEIENDPLITSWKQMTHIKKIDPRMGEQIRAQLVKFPTPKKESQIRGDEQPPHEIYRSSTPEFTEKIYREGLTDLMYELLDKYSDHYLKEDTLEALKVNRPLPKRLLMTDNNYFNRLQLYMYNSQANTNYTRYIP